MKKPITEYEKHKYDFQTPPHVAAYMVSLLPEGVKFVLEPTPGIGNIVTELVKKGYCVTAPEDYFLLGDFKWDAVVMNPPFSLNFTNIENAKPHQIDDGMKMGYNILFECMKKCDKVIALMPYFVLTDSDKRTISLKKYGIKSITHLNRSTFNYTRIQCVVLDLEKGFKGDTVYKVLDLVNTTQTSIYDNT